MKYMEMKAEKERIQVIYKYYYYLNFIFIKALKASKVKLEANDVVASYIILHGLIFLPLFFLIYTIIFGIIM